MLSIVDALRVGVHRHIVAIYAIYGTSYMESVKPRFSYFAFPSVASFKFNYKKLLISGY